MAVRGEILQIIEDFPNHDLSLKNTLEVLGKIRNLGSQLGNEAHLGVYCDAVCQLTGIMYLRRINPGAQDFSIGLKDASFHAVRITLAGLSGSAEVDWEELDRKIEARIYSNKAYSN
jgi:hypothetical protein